MIPDLVRYLSPLFVVALAACAPSSPAGGGPIVSPSAPAPPPVAPPPPPPVPALFLGSRQSCALADGQARCWGYNASGQLLVPLASNAPCATTYGITASNCVRAPVAVEALKGARAVAFGDEHACSADARGVVRCWGDSEVLGLPEEGLTACGQGRHCRLTPRAVEGISDVEQLAAGINLTCALTSKQEAWCWGWNEFGQVGDGTTDGTPGFAGPHTRPAPTRVVGVPKATQIAAGYRHACALLADGTVRCWGEADSGQLGDGTLGAPCGNSTCRPAPVAVQGLDKVKQIVSGAIHVCALREDGSVFCWGFSDGRLGDGTTDGVPCGAKGHWRCRPAPVRVAGVEGAVEIASGAEATCARLADGTVRCWGRRAGSKTSDPRALRPEAVAGIAGATRLVMGDAHACALTGGGQLACWGSNVFGQLGDGTVENRPAPVSPKR